MKRLLIPASLSVLALGCSANAASLKPALLDKPEAEAIRTALSALLGHGNSQIADSVFTKNSAMVLEHPQIKDDKGNPVMGKQLDMPFRFRLMFDGQTCYLTQLDTDKQVPLPGIGCHYE